MALNLAPGTMALFGTASYAVWQYATVSAVRCGVTALNAKYGVGTFTRSWNWFTVLALLTRDPLMLDQALACGLGVNTGWYWMLANHPDTIKKVEGGRLLRKLGRPLLHFADAMIHIFPLLLIVWARGGANFSSLYVPLFAAFHLWFWARSNNLHTLSPFVRADKIYQIDPPLDNGEYEALLSGFLRTIIALVVAGMDLVDDGVVSWCLLGIWVSTLAPKWLIGSV